MALRAGDDRAAGLRPVRRDRVLGPDEPPGLARLRAAAPRDAIEELGRGSLFEPGAERPCVRPHGGRPVCERRHQLPADRAASVRRADAEGRGGRCSRATSRPSACRAPPTTRDSVRSPGEGVAAPLTRRSRRAQPGGASSSTIVRPSRPNAPSRQATRIASAVPATMIVEIALISGVTPNLTLL